MAETKRRGRRWSDEDEAWVGAVADALLRRCEAMPQPDTERESAALEAIEDAESLAESWERVLSRGLVPVSWLDAADRRFYGVSGRCARCGHKARCAKVRCRHDERTERDYGFAAFPTSFWDLLVLVGHTQTLIDAEARARGHDAVMRGLERAARPRDAWTWVFETPDRDAFSASLSQRQRRLFDGAVARVEARLGLPLPFMVPSAFASLRALVAQGPTSAALEREEDVVYTGFTYEWSELRCRLTPSLDAARRMPRAVLLGI